MSVEIISNNIPSDKKYEDNDILTSNAETKLDRSIKKIIEKEGFITYKINKNCVVTNGGNYLGDLYEIDIKGETKEGYKELNLFVKKIINSQTTIISVKDVYETEMFVYKELMKVFNEIQDEAEIPINERYRMVKSYDETNNEAIIMENVAKKGFHTAYRMDVVTLEFAELAIKELAKFHGLSFVLKVKRPEYFEKKIMTLKMPFKDGPEWRGFIDNMLETTIAFTDQDTRNRVEKFCFGIANRFLRHYHEISKNGCLCHNDYRPNNMMAKMTNGIVSEIIPVDYQLISYGCPLIDFFYFIVCSTDREFRKKHLTYLKDLYYETLTKFLDYFDLDVNTVYSRDQFEKDYKDKLEYGLIITLASLPFMFASEDDVPDVSKNELSSLKFKVDEKFGDRLRGAVKDYIEWGVL